MEDPWQGRSAWWLVPAAPAAVAAALPLVVLGFFAWSAIGSLAATPGPQPIAVAGTVMLLLVSGAVAALPWVLLRWAPRRVRWTVGALLAVTWVIGWFVRVSG